MKRCGCCDSTEIATPHAEDGLPFCLDCDAVETSEGVWERQ